MAIIVRSNEEIEELQDRVGEHITRGSSRYRGMTYEQGIDDTIQWLIDEHSMTLDEFYPKEE